jgi:hypothetical protein
MLLRQAKADTLTFTGISKCLLNEELAQSKAGRLKRLHIGLNPVKEPLTFGSEEKTHHSRRADSGLIRRSAGPEVIHEDQRTG